MRYGCGRAWRTDDAPFALITVDIITLKSGVFEVSICDRQTMIYPMIYSLFEMISTRFNSVMPPFYIFYTLAKWKRLNDMVV